MSSRYIVQIRKGFDWEDYSHPAWADCVWPVRSAETDEQAINAFSSLMEFDRYPADYCRPEYRLIKRSETVLARDEDKIL